MSFRFRFRWSCCVDVVVVDVVGDVVGVVAASACAVAASLQSRWRSSGSDRYAPATWTCCAGIDVLPNGARVAVVVGDDVAVAANPTQHFLDDRDGVALPSSQLLWCFRLVYRSPVHSRRRGQLSDPADVDDDDDDRQMWLAAERPVRPWHVGRHRRRLRRRVAAAVGVVRRPLLIRFCLLTLRLVSMKRLGDGCCGVAVPTDHP